MIVVLQEWSIMIILNHWWRNQLQLHKYWDLHIAQLRVKVSQLLALFFHCALENKWRMLDFQRLKISKKKTWSLWTRSISMYDSSSETPESRSVAAVSDDDNFRFSSWRQFTILFFSCSQCFFSHGSPVNAWWWSSSLWFPTYNALPPKNGDKVFVLHSLIFIWSLFMQ